MSTVFPILAAVGSAAVFGLSTSLEHREAGQAPSGSIALVWHLLRQPLWLLGLAASVVALGLYALAVGTGALGLVQPILITGIVFALPIRAAMDRTFPSRRELGSAVLTTAGLAVFLIAASPGAASRSPHGSTALLFVGAGVPVAVLLTRRGMRESGRLRGVLLGCAAGIVFGLMAGALKMTVLGLGDPLALLQHWPLWAFIALAGWGTILNQHAYRDAPLAVSMPIVNIFGPLIGIVFAGVVFGEIPHHSPIDLALELVGLVAVAAGLRGLARAETDRRKWPVPDEPSFVRAARGPRADRLCPDRAARLPEAALFVGFVLPGETAVFMGGVLAAAGVISLPALSAIVVTAAILGDAVGYGVGRRYGPRILQLGFLHRHAARLDAAQERLRERGGWAVFVGRFTAFLRAVMPGLAGMSHMPWHRFFVFNAAGGLVWGLGVALLGYATGNSYQHAAAWLGRSSSALLAVFVVAGLVLWQRHRHRHRSSSTTTGTPPDTTEKDTDMDCPPPNPDNTVLVVIPTYNEADNIWDIVCRVRAAVPHADVLIADDGSPDGTSDIADLLSTGDRHVHVLHRPGKAGLGAAYLAAFAWGLNRDYDVLVEMDADGSHQPEQLPRLLAALDDGADLVLGSRWVPGGRVENWPRRRELLSRGGNAYVRIALGLPQRDATGGFRAYRREALERISLADVESQGYCFQVDLTRRAVEAGLRVAEVPITFVERVRGESKMSGRIVVEALALVTLWAFQRQLAKFGNAARHLSAPRAVGGVSR